MKIWTFVSILHMDTNPKNRQLRIITVFGKVSGEQNMRCEHNHRRLQGKLKVKEGED